MQGVRFAGVLIVETGVGVKPTHTRISIAGVGGISSRLDAEFTAVRQDKGTASRDREWVTSWRGVVDAPSQLDVVFGGLLRQGSRRLYTMKGAPCLDRTPYLVVRQNKRNTSRC